MNSLFIMTSPLFVLIISFISLSVGSFLNVVVYRLPQMIQNSWHQESNTHNHATLNLCFPRSFCPRCQHQLSIFDKLPLLSYILIRGKCRYCKNTVAWRYPLLELLSALTGAIIAWHFGICWHALIALIFTWGLLILATIDWEHGLLPDQITLPLLWCGLLCSLEGGFCNSQTAVLGAIAGYTSFWLLAWVFLKITKKIGMGHGDFKLLALIGAWLGWQQLPLVILLASLLGSFAGIGFIVLKQQQRGTPIAFGPYLALSGWIALLWGKNWLQWWLAYSQ